MEDESWKEKIVTPRVGVAGVVIYEDKYGKETLAHLIPNEKRHVLMIRRKFPPHGIAFPGGFQEVGEAVAQTAIREVREETGVNANPIGIMRINTMPHTDPRFHVTAIYVLMESDSLFAESGDDAEDAFWMHLSNHSHDHEMSNTTISVLNNIRESRVRTISLG